ncbi:Clp protease N-terminal domain-containing protein [Actinosynnema sp. NPDC047251]|uniref:Clp R domain-containing protein n=1 Tax=Saccharothrix espanaensis (strain ATCC 51144 / DSM 44229 / JCM 9112 / NBRC 15066 / NRRL 15764) TaxID=1179773 RepID=K0K9G0_SACES|nr:toll/interleukin-1 receptor domain-containing protein [Saccharothrix espanaensis]CCH33258.1 hypothetical protein BN6_60020 [Saccharothrix espanaensis DSM 44229]
MFERFTERAQYVTVLAKKEAELLHHGYIGTEHLLIGLLLERSGSAARVLMSLGLSPQHCVRHVVDIVGRGREQVRGHLPFTPRAKRAMDQAVRQATALGHGRISTEHLLLGVLDEDEGVAAEVLVRSAVSLDDARERLLAVMSGYELPAPRIPAAVYVSYLRPDDRHVAGRIADWLHHSLGGDQVVLDAEEAVEGSDAVVVVISPQWAPHWPMSQELEVAAAWGIRIVPVLVDGARMPAVLPEGLAALVEPPAIEIGHDTFRQDMTALTERLQ